MNKFQFSLILVLQGWWLTLSVYGIDNFNGGNVPKIFLSDSQSSSSQRRGRSRDTHICDQITSVPAHLTFITRYNHYRKFTHAYDIPIVSSAYVSDAALKRACYVVRFLLADRPIIRKFLYKNHGRIGIMGRNEGTTSIPEHSFLGAWWDSRARGLGGTLAVPISTGAEENLLCWSGDRYSREDIFLHEFSHGIQEVAIRGGAIPGYFARLTTAYNSAKSRGLWRSTYAMSTVQEYFAEGVQSYFEVNDYASTPNGVHNHVNTRSKLRSYDPTLYALVKEVFPCGNIIKKRCDKSGAGKPFRMNCDGSRPVATVKPTTTFTMVLPNTTTGVTPTTITPTTEPPSPPPPPSPCADKNRWCSSWKGSGYCKRTSQHYRSMLTHCRKTCGCCDDQYVDQNSNCSSWASKGECEKNPAYMLIKCKKSCKTFIC